MTKDIGHLLERTAVLNKAARQGVAERMRARHTPDSSPDNPRYVEYFHRLIFQ